MPSNGWQTGGFHPGGQKKLTVGGAAVQLKVMSGGRYEGQQRIYGEAPDGGWYGAVIDPAGELLGFGTGRTKADARAAMLRVAGLQA